MMILEDQESEILGGRSSTNPAIAEKQSPVEPEAVELIESDLKIFVAGGNLN